MTLVLAGNVLTVTLTDSERDVILLQETQHLNSLKNIMGNHLNNLALDFTTRDKDKVLKRIERATAVELKSVLDLLK